MGISAFAIPEGLLPPGNPSLPVGCRYDMAAIFNYAFLHGNYNRDLFLVVEPVMRFLG
jgi:hypothetical protein